MRLLTFLEALDIMTMAMYEGYSIDVIYTDFSKAFDKVPHKLLILKLKAFGISENIISWIEAWLRCRKQRVVLGENASEWCNVTSGVPQGSVLGPLLFVLYINDLPTNMHHSMKLYADDSKIIGVIKSPEDTIELQRDIDRAVEWSNQWLLKFNIEKCKALHIGTVSTRGDT